MADPAKIVSTNASGNFFVDTTCINCDACRQLAPATFVDAGEYSAVYQQPATDIDVIAATRALLCCPTGSIGTKEKNQAAIVRQEFPLLLDDNVYYCGFNSAKSYGANSFFVKHQGGNWLIDSPKFLPFLVEKFEQLGGIKYIFLTHRDDVADAAKYAEKFTAVRIIHADELYSQPESEIVFEGYEASEFAPEFTIIPVPGHTKGHMLLLYKNKFLFTGDHLSYEPETRGLYAFRNHCWYSWPEQTKSMEKLTHYDFEWVLAGHGDKVRLPFAEMKKQLKALVERMKD
ncbi:MAG: MBL fold metallo-hydrolase [Leptolyngbya sp.]|nr:MBL fold metallo-hydrolase [Candidatus Melainabacteria bacterium]